MLENIVWKKRLHHQIYSFYALQGIWNTVMTPQRSHGFALVFRPYDLRPEIYINRLDTATKIFIAMDYLLLMPEKNLHFGRRQKHVARKFFSHPVEVIWSRYFGNCNNSGCIKVDNFPNLWKSLFLRNNKTLVQFFVWKA